MRTRTHAQRTNHTPKNTKNHAAENKKGHIGVPFCFAFVCIYARPWSVLRSSRSLDIAAKWGKQRESNHGNMQRVMQYLQASLGLGGSVAGGVTGGALGGVTGGATALAPVVVTGYGANKALNSQAARNLVMYGMPTSLLSPNVERLMVPTTTLMLNEMQR